MADDAAPQRQQRRGDRRRMQKRWQAALGVTAGVSPVNIAAFMLHAASSIVFLVFLNAMQPFLIAQLDAKSRQGAMSGTLIFYDELLSLFLALLWGSAADVLGTRPVAVTGYTFIALALFSFTRAVKPWPDLLLARLLFAVGGSAVTAMLTGILNSYSATYQEVQWRRRGALEDALHEAETTPDESRPLLPRSRSSSSSPAQKQTHGRLAALTGLTTGCGALFAVFVLLRLPAILAGVQDGQDNKHKDKSRSDTDQSIRLGTRQAFTIVAALALVVALALAVGLKMDAPPSTPNVAPTREGPEEERVEEHDSVAQYANAREARRQRLKARLQRSRAPGPSLPNTRLPSILHGAARLARGTLNGFALARKESSLPLAYLGGALARASTIATTVFVPLLVTRFFYSTGLCSVEPSPDIPAEELKRRCRQAFVVASILSGVIQLIALLCAPLIGYLCDARTPAQTLLLSSTIGVAAYLAMGLGLPHDGDPRTPIAYVAAVGIGFAQIGAIVASLALCASAKARLAHVGSSEGSSEPAPAVTAAPTSGAIAGAYSATGGLSILLVSKLGGWLSDSYAPAAFLLMAGMAAITAIASLVVVIRESRAHLS